MNRVLGLAAQFVCVLIAAIGPVARSVGATTSSIFTVNSTLDEHNVDASTGLCVSTPSGKCTLRAAVEAANFASTPSKITVPLVCMCSRVPATMIMHWWATSTSSTI